MGTERPAGPPQPRPGRRRAEGHRRGRRRTGPAAHARRASGSATSGSTRTPPTSASRSCKGLYRDMVLVRRVDREANALQRQGQLGIWVPLLGQEAAQIGSGRAMRPQDMAFPSLPRARRRVVPRASTRPSCWGSSAAPTTAGGTRSRAGSTCTRSSSATSASTPPATRWASGSSPRWAIRRPTRGHDLLLRRRRHQPGRRPRGLRLGRRLRRAARLLLPEQPVGDLRARRSARPGCRSTSGRRGYGFPGIRVDGNDVLACLAVTRWALEECRTGNGPVLIEAFTYRMDAHTTSDDPTRYRLADELELWKLKDPIERVRVTWSARTASSRSSSTAWQAESDELAARFRQYCWSMPAPRPGPDVLRGLRGGLAAAGRPARGVPRLPRVLRGRRAAMTELTMAKALNDGLRAAMERDPKVLVMGEDVGKLGGVFRVTDGLQKDFGEQRVLDTPLAESGIIGTAVGLAIRGFRPVCEIQFDGFVFPGYDQIVSQLAKLRFRLAGPGADAGRGAHPVRRRDRCGRAPLRVAGGAVRARRGPQGGRLLERRRRLLDDPAGHRLRRSGDLLRAEAAVLGEGARWTPTPSRRRRCTPAGRCGPASRSRSSATARWSGPAWRRPPPPRPTATTSR